MRRSYYTFTTHHMEGPLAGQIWLCRKCPSPARPNAANYRLCAFHYREYERLAGRVKLRRDPRRLAAMLKALAYPPPGGTSPKDFPSRFHMLQHKRGMISAQKHWRDVLLNHPERIPPGFHPSMLPPGCNLS